MRREYFKPGDRVCIVGDHYDYNLICKVTREQYHQYIYTDVYGWVNVTTNNVHPVMCDPDGWVNVDLTLARREYNV